MCEGVCKCAQCLQCLQLKTVPMWYVQGGVQGAAASYPNWVCECVCRCVEGNYFMATL